MKLKSIIKIDETITLKDDYTNIGFKKLFDYNLCKDGGANLEVNNGEESGTLYLNKLKVENIVLNPWENDHEIMDKCKSISGTDSATIFNLIPFLPTKEERIKIIKEVLNLVKPNGSVLIHISEPEKRGNIVEAMSAWEMSQPISFYENELKSVFKSIIKKDNYLIIKKE